MAEKILDFPEINNFLSQLRLFVLVNLCLKQQAHGLDTVFKFIIAS